MTASNQIEASPWRLCVAPMMDWTDRHCRYFHRLLSADARLYTEMVTTGALLHGDAERLLAFNLEEHPVALQVGGNDPGELAASAQLAAQHGYDEINLNVGCPSDRVQRGRFGACLMLEPATVRDGVAAMREAVDVPVTVKCRLGVDEFESWDFFTDFVGMVRESGCEVFIVHARKAWLSGLSPKENRQIPTLRYEWVYRLKAEQPDLTVVLNGGLETVEDIGEALHHVDGVMLGRAAYHTPWVLYEAQRALFDGDLDLEREQVVAAMSEYLARQTADGVPVKHVTRHMLGLFQGLPGARRWRRWISENAHRNDGDTRLLESALAAYHSLA